MIVIHHFLRPYCVKSYDDSELLSTGIKVMDKERLKTVKGSKVTADNNLRIYWWAFTGPVDLAPSSCATSALMTSS